MCHDRMLLIGFLSWSLSLDMPCCHRYLMARNGLYGVEGGQSVTPATTLDLPPKIGQFAGWNVLCPNRASRALNAPLDPLFLSPHLKHHLAFSSDYMPIHLNHKRLSGGRAISQLNQAN